MKGYNLPDNVDPNDPEATWNKVEVEEEKSTTQDLSQKKVVKKGLAKGTYYKVYCGDVFFAWMSRKQYKEFLSNL